MKSRADQLSLENRIKLEMKNQELISAGDKVVVALSGGPDSVFLAEMLYKLKDELKISLKACHYNHKLRGEAGDADQKFVAQYCEQHGIPLLVGERQPEEVVKSEDDARKLRYNFFEKILSQQGRGGTKIAIAHQMDDSAETYLMRLIRGSGLKGLSSILPRRKNFIRPLLRISKKEILEFLERHHISYCTDQTNFEDLYFRNQIRNQLLPKLVEFNPQVVKKIAETAESTAQDYRYIDEAVEQLFARLVVEMPEGYSIDAADYAKLHSVEKRYLVISCIDKLGGKDYTFAQINNIVQIISQNVGKKMLPLPHSLRFELKNGKIYLYNDNLRNIKEKDGKSQKK